MAGEHVGHGRTAALVGYVEEVGAGLLRHQLSRDVGDRHRACRAVRQAARRLARKSHRFLECLDTERRVGDEDDRRIADLARRYQILEWIERHAGVHVRIDDDGAFKHHHHRLAIWLGFRDVGGADVARTTRAIFHDHRLAEQRRQVFADQPAGGIDDAAGRESRDQVHRLGRPGRLGAQQRGRQCRACGQRPLPGDEVSA